MIYIYFTLFCIAIIFTVSKITPKENFHRVAYFFIIDFLLFPIFFTTMMLDMFFSNRFEITVFTILSVASINILATSSAIIAALSFLNLKKASFLELLRNIVNVFIVIIASILYATAWEYKFEPPLIYIKILNLLSILSIICIGIILISKLFSKVNEPPKEENNPLKEPDQLTKPTITGNVEEEKIPTPNARTEKVVKEKVPDIEILEEKIVKEKMVAKPENKRNINEISNTKNSKHFPKLAIVAVIVILVLLVALFCIKYQPIPLNNKSLKEILDNVPRIVNNPSYDNYDYYTIYNDKIYVYVHSLNKDTIYSMNIDGSDKKVFKQSDELRETHFYFVYQDEIYFKSSSGNHKINLNTGEISSLNSSDQILSKTLKNGQVYTIGEPSSGGMYYYSSSSSFFKKIDLKTGKIIKELHTNRNFINDDYIILYNTDDVYHVAKTTIENQIYHIVYKNGQILRQIKYDNNGDIKLIAVNNNYLYYEIDSVIYKLNLKTNKVEKNIRFPHKDFERIDSNNEDNYFYSSNVIYKFSFTTDTFDVFLEDVPYEVDEVYDINNKLYFTRYANVITRPDNEPTSVIIYDKNNNKVIDNYTNLKRVTFDDNYMYLVHDNETAYSISSIPL